MEGAGVAVGGVHSRLSPSGRVISPNMGFKETELWKHRGHMQHLVHHNDYSMNMFHQCLTSRKYLFVFILNSVSIVLTYLCGKFCLKSDFRYLSLKWMSLGLMLCFIMQRHSCIFKCHINVQILCGLCTHTYTHTHANSAEHELSTSKQSWIIYFIYEQLWLRGSEIEKEGTKNSKQENKSEFPVCL